MSGVPRRLAEAERMGFRRAIVPAGVGGLTPTGPPRDHDRPGRPLAAVPSPDGLTGLTGLMEVREVEDVRHAIAAALAD